MINNSPDQTQQSSVEVAAKAALAVAKEQLRKRNTIQNAQIELAKQMPPPEVLTIQELGKLEIDHSTTLLGDRWLCRGQAAINVGPSGIGKSSMAMQQDLCWSVGKEAFGIAPSKPLKILTIQAENDQGDLIEMLQGVKAGMDLTAEEEQLLGTNVIYAFEQARTGPAFVQAVLRPLLEKHRPDIVRIDPLQAFAGCDLTNASETAELLRNCVNPALKEFQCGLILMHHTPKQNSNRDTSKNRTVDWMYSGAGSHDIVNWARAIIAIEPCQKDGVYKFIAAKRGGRIGWRNPESDEKELIRWFKWATGSICWEAAEPCEAEPSNEAAVKEFLEEIPFEPGIEKKILEENANKFLKIPLRKFKVLMEKALEEDLIETREVPRKGARAKIVVVRTLKSAEINPCVATRGNLGGIKCDLFAGDRALHEARQQQASKSENGQVVPNSIVAFDSFDDSNIEAAVKLASEKWT